MLVLVVVAFGFAFYRLSPSKPESVNSKFDNSVKTVDKQAVIPTASYVGFSVLTMACLQQCLLRTVQMVSTALIMILGMLPDLR